MSLEQQRPLIEQLKVLLVEEDFDHKFEQLTLGESSANRFLLKMELKRLNEPCQRRLDFREHYKCQPIKVGNLVHFIDKALVGAFNEQLHIFGGRYTVGVYESLTALDKNRLDSAHLEPSEEVDPSQLAQALVLGNYIQRQEVRMNFSIKAQAWQNPLQRMEVVTSDLSVNGARVRLSGHIKIDAAKPLFLRLTGIPKELKSSISELKLGVEYRIAGIEGEAQYQWLRLARVGGGQEYSEWLQQIIDNHKSKYKVDVNEVLLATSSFAYETQYLPRLQCLPLFGDNQGIQFGLSSRDNQDAYAYFDDLQKRSQLAKVLTKPRIDLAMRNPNTEHKLLYSFVYRANGRQSRYAATLAELNRSGLKQLFFSFGSQLASWRIWQLDATELGGKQALHDYCLPGEEQPLPLKTRETLNQLKYLLRLDDVTSEAGKLCYQAKRSEQDPNLLQQFRVDDSDDKPIKLLAVSWHDRRQEKRFALQTLVEVSQGSQSFMALSEDISASGIKLRFKDAPALDKTKPVALSYPKLQKLAGSNKLAKIPYQLLSQRSEGVIGHFKALHQYDKGQNLAFLAKLLTHNQDKLTSLNERPDGETELTEGLKNLFLQQLNSVPFFFHKRGHKAQADLVCRSLKHNRVLDWLQLGSSVSGRYHLQQLASEPELAQLLQGPLTKALSTEAMTAYELLIQIKVKPSGGYQCQLHPITGLSISEQQVLINKIQAKGRMMAIRVARGRVDAINFERIEAEMNYLTIHSVGKAKQLEKELRSTLAIGEILDISAEMLQRHSKD